jgi:para-nitrobenzyl esterase
LLLTARLGAGASPSIQALRALPATGILKVEPDGLHKAPYVGVTIDGYVLPKRPADLFAKGREHRVDMLLGNLAHEWIPGVRPPEDLKQVIEGIYDPNRAKQALALYQESGTDSLYGTPAEQWIEDIGFRCSAVAQLIWHAAAGNRAFEFQFDHVPPTNTAGNKHAQDIPYVFGQLDATAYTAVDHAVSDAMQRYWTNFAKSGNPNGPGLPKWPQFDPATRAFLAFEDVGPVAKEGLRRSFCDLFIENLKRNVEK